jgi:ubiquinol-cytochrome c reductase cytochrome b subunit
VFSHMKEWVAHRFGWQPIHDHFLNRRVPRSKWYFGDGATLLFLLGIQVLTGAILSLTYSPTPDTAYESVQHITGEQIVGGFLRGLHYWSAGLMVVMLFVHLFRQILMGGYKSPREGTWLIGVVLFFGVLTMSYTGYLLRWDERAVHGMRVSLHMLYRVPLVGESLVYFVQGGSEIGARTLSRFYSLHVIWLPLLILGLAGYHLYLIVLRGTISVTERNEPVGSAQEQEKVYKSDAHSETRGETFYPETAFKSGTMAVAVAGLAVVLALIYGPPRLYPEANLVETSYPVEEWWFWWYSALIAQLPRWMAPTFVVVFPLAVFLILVLLPFMDRGPDRGVRRRPIALAVVVICVLLLLYLTDLRRRSPWTGWPDPVPPAVPRGVTLSEHAEEGRLVFARKGCTSCHAVGGGGAEVGSDLARLMPPYSRKELRDYVLRPPEGVAMPPYEGRISEEDLERVVEFVLVAQTFPREVSPR